MEETTMETPTTRLTCCRCGEDFEILGTVEPSGCAFCWECCDAIGRAKTPRCQLHCAVCGLPVPLPSDYVSDAHGIYHPVCDSVRDPVEIAAALYHAR
ncbi:MAG: hypothetical protein ACRD0K_19370 [Egibacteraceae bacterium]